MNVTPAALTGALAALALTSLTFAEPKPEPAPSNPERVSFDFVVDDQVRRIVIELNPGSAPQTVANFKKLIEEGFYNGLAIHRAIPHYLIQVGDPLTKDDSAKSTWGTGSPGYTIPAEIKLKHQRGCVAMARLPDGRNPTRASNGSQFYIALADMSQLDGQYTVFGQVVRGIEHLDYISEKTTDTNDVPRDRIKVSAVVGEGSSKTGAGEAIAQGAGNVAKGAMSVASQGVRAAGSAVKDADKLIPKIDLPKVPFLGGKSEAIAETPAAAAPAPASATTMPAPATVPAAESQEVILQEVPGDEVKEKRGLKLPSLPKFRKPDGSAFRDPVPADELIPTSSTSAKPAEPKPTAPMEAAQPKSAPTAAPVVAANAPTSVPPATGPTPAPAPAPSEGVKPTKEKVVVPVTPPAPKEKGFLGRAITRFW